MLGRKSLIAWATAASLFVASFAIAAEDTAASRLQGAPPVIQAVVKAVVGQADVEEFAKRNIDGRIVYEVGYIAHGVVTATQIDEAGQVVRRATDVDLSKVPGAVLDGAVNSEADGKILSAALVTVRGGHQFYELDVRVHEMTFLMKVAGDGSVISEAMEGAGVGTQSSDSHD
jgi:hypothetical protein